MASTEIPEHYRTDPMATELIRCGLPLAEVDSLVEQAAIYEHLAGLSRQEAEALASGGETYTKPS